MNWTLPVDAVVPGCARTARVASDRPFGGSAWPGSHRLAYDPTRPASRRSASGSNRPACRRSACTSDWFGSRPRACIPVWPSCFRPASHRRTRDSGGPPGVRGPAITLTEWSFDPGRDV